MKTNFLLFILLLGIFSCADKKKEEETKAAIQKIEAVENELHEVSKEIDVKTKDLEDSLKDLEGI